MKKKRNIGLRIKKAIYDRTALDIHCHYEVDSMVKKELRLPLTNAILEHKRPISEAIHDKMSAVSPRWDRRWTKYYYGEA